MSWQEAASVVVILAGLGAAAFLVGQRPAFWIEFGSRIARKLLPPAFAYMTKRMSPEDEKRMQDCVRRGGHWDNFKKRCVSGR